MWDSALGRPSWWKRLGSADAGRLIELVPAQDEEVGCDPRAMVEGN